MKNEFPFHFGLGPYEGDETPFLGIVHLPMKRNIQEKGVVTLF
ncbi:MAG: hypothetical protein CM15mP83_2600 [Flavobacteriaceae bacterium]|nr:MAG: hypothetical protein CM15mP83_2600 [Flavobacteriaceae bacterium]